MSDSSVRVCVPWACSLTSPRWWGWAAWMRWFWCNLGPTLRGLAGPGRVDRSQCGPVLLPRREGREHGDPERGVVHAPGEERVAGLLQRDPAHRHTQLLALALVALPRRHHSDVACEVDAQHLVEPAGRADVVGEHVPRGGDQVGLLVQLPGRAEVRRLAVHVEQARGDLPLVRPHGVAVLLDEADPALVVERRDGHRTGVADVLTGDLARRTEVDPVADDVPDHAVHRHLGVQDGEVGVAVGQLLRALGTCRALGLLAHAVTSAVLRGRSTSTNRAARWALIAASTRPAKSGWARCGRDLNSGCACVET